MTLDIHPIENHREREKGVLVYPVYSRRSQGLSIGINLYPNKKNCNFDCPYCEIFPFSNNAAFSLQQLEEDLRSCINNAKEQNIPIKDICFSGNGEPTLSPSLGPALKLAAQIRTELSPSAQLVLITNGTGLLKQEVFSLLKEASLGTEKLDIWLKVDAATPEWYKKINRSEISFDELTAKIKEFVSVAPLTIQTMLCQINGKAPPQEEAHEWNQLILELTKSNNIRKVQVYGKARPAPDDPISSFLLIEELEDRAQALRNIFTDNGIAVSVDVYN